MNLVFKTRNSFLIFFLLLTFFFQTIKANTQKKKYEEVILEDLLLKIEKDNLNRLKIFSEKLDEVIQKKMNVNIHTTISISGEGMKVYIPILILEHIEKMTNLRTPEMFNIFSGSSTGSILCLLMNTTKDKNTKDILYDMNFIKKIFIKNFLPKKKFLGVISYSKIKNFWSFNGFFGPKLNRKSIDTMLDHLFLDKKLDEIQNYILFHYYDIKSKKLCYMWIEKNSPYLNNIDIKISDIAKIFISSPTYFSPYSSQNKILSKKIGKISLEGSILSNNTSLKNILMSKDIFYHLKDDKKHYTFNLSIGTKTVCKQLQKNKIKLKNSGKIQWINLIPSIVKEGNQNFCNKIISIEGYKNKNIYHVCLYPEIKDIDFYHYKNSDIEYLEKSFQNFKKKKKKMMDLVIEILKKINIINTRNA